MHILRRSNRTLFKTVTGIIYLSFFLVQFDIHLNGSYHGISFFSSNYCSIHSGRGQHASDHFGTHKDSRHNNLKLNKRFHPEHLFTLPMMPKVLAVVIVQDQKALINNKEPLTRCLFNSPSAKGPSCGWLTTR